MGEGIIVIDLDGTLCNSGHREHLARAGQWDDFHSLLMQDEPWSDVKRFLELADATVAELRGFDIELVGVTGRNERYRTQTLNWLNKHDISIDSLLMRPDDDYRSDHELKPQLLEQYLSDIGRFQSDVLFILEDRDKVVEAWRDRGYNCWQVRPGGY